jgi:hypothetical protein
LRALADNQNDLALVWLRVIPYNNFTKLPSRDISVGLHILTLLPGHLSVCRYCFQHNELGHDETCQRRENLRTFRHESLKKTIAWYLKLVEKTEVEVEPHVPNSLDRTDIRIRGKASFLQESCEIDLTITSVFSQAVPVVDSSAANPWAGVVDQIERHLHGRARIKVNNYAGRTATSFHPLVLSSGGTLHKEAKLIFGHWQSVMSKDLWRFFFQDMSISLLRTRARVFSL